MSPALAPPTAPAAASGCLSEAVPSGQRKTQETKYIVPSFLRFFNRFEFLVRRSCSIELQIFVDKYIPGLVLINQLQLIGKA